MNVIVIRARVIRVATQHAFEHRNDLDRTFRGLAVERPEFPRPQVHHAFGVKRGCVEIVWITFYELAHRVLVIDGELRLIGLYVSRITFGERVDVRALVFRRFRRELDRFLQIAVSLDQCRPVGLHVVIRSERERHAPVGHRELRIEFGCLFERAHGFFVIEARTGTRVPD